MLEAPGRSLWSLVRRPVKALAFVLGAGVAILWSVFLSMGGMGFSDGIESRTFVDWVLAVALLVGAIALALWAIRPLDDGDPKEREPHVRP